MSILPEPACQLGYPRDAIEQILAEDIATFDEWMHGQAVAICDGRRYDHDRRDYDETGCGPHGVVVYPWDLDRYLNGDRRVL
jgi:hypothetical protein